MKIVKKLSIVLFCAVALFSNTFAQKTMNEDFRKTAPAPLAPRPINLPQPFEKVLANGLKVIVIEDKRLPVVNFRLAFRSGNVNEPKDSIGITSMVTGLLKEGTTTRTSKQIAEEIEKIGGSIGANAGDDNTTISATALSQYTDTILELMADVTLNPSFPQSEIDLQKQNTIQGLEFQRSDAGFLAGEQMAKILYGNHPYSIVSPSKESVSGITREKLVAFHKQILNANNGLMIVVGNVDRTKIVGQIEKLFGKMTKGAVAKTEFPAPPVRAEKTLTLVDRPGSAQSNIILSNLAIKRNDADFFPLLVLNQVYGGGASARLFMNIREDKGYTYGAYSDFDTRRLAGSFGSNAEVRTPVTGASLKEFFYEINRIRTDAVPKQELEDAKSFLTGVFPLKIETQEGLLGQFLNIQLNDLPPTYLQTYRDNVTAVTAADVQRVANKYLQPDKIAIVIVGDVGEILEQVKPYSSKIDVFDTDGKKMDIADFGKTAATGAAANVNGKWTLSVNAMGQTLPVTLDLTQDGDKISGSMNSPLGSSALSDVKLAGNKLSASADVNFQGQPLTLKITGTVDADGMKGNVDAGIPGAPAFAFTGKREAAADNSTSPTKPKVVPPNE